MRKLFQLLVVGGADAFRALTMTALTPEYDVVAARDSAAMFSCLDHREVTVVILAASSDSGPPKTNLGNMPAF